MNVHRHIARITASNDPESALADFIAALGRELTAPTVDAITLSTRFNAAAPAICAAFSLDRPARQARRDAKAFDAAKRGFGPGVSDLEGYDLTTGQVRATAG